MILVIIPDIILFPIEILLSEFSYQFKSTQKSGFADTPVNSQFAHSRLVNTSLASLLVYGSNLGSTKA
jgi:hypothetical protein